MNAKNTPFGSYQLQTGANFRTEVPAAYGQVDTLAGPQQSYDSKGNVRIAHREYLFDILSTTPEYQIQEIVIANPTVQQSFPWLSGMAGNFQKFCFEKLCIHFVTQSPSSSPGSVMIVPIYDVDSSLPSTKNDALTFQDTTRSPAWQECCSLLPRSRLCGYKDYFTKIVQTDLKLSIPAKIVVATSGASDSSPITGEIWIEYDIRMSCPQRDAFGYEYIQVNPGPRISTFPFSFNVDTGAPQNNISLGLKFTTNSITGFALGQYNIYFQYSSDSVARSFTLGYSNGINHLFSWNPGPSSQVVFYILIIDVPASAINPTVTITPSPASDFSDDNVFVEVIKSA